MHGAASASSACSARGLLTTPIERAKIAQDTREVIAAAPHICGVNDASVSEGTSIETGTISVSTVFSRTLFAGGSRLRPTGSTGQTEMV